MQKSQEGTWRVMSRGKKKEIFQKKITQFPKQLDRPEELTDENIDRILRESIRMEADEIEAQMNQDPTLIGVGASDDLFSKIVAELKDRGEWEEEAELQARGEREGEAELQVHGEHEEETLSEKKLIDEEVLPVQIADAQGKTEQSEQAVRGESREAESARPDYRAAEPEQVDREACQREESEPPDIKSAFAENSKDELPEQNRELIRSMLSEEDREALEFGYQMKARERKKQEKRKKRRRHLKQTGIAAASFVAVLGIGMSSEANQKRVMQIWNAVMENADIRMAVNYLADAEAYKEGKEEQEAKDAIREQLGIEPITFMYLPENMQYFSYEIDADASYAVMRYKFNHRFFDVCMQNNGQESGLYYQVDGEIQEEEILMNEQGISVKVTKVISDGDKYNMAALATNDTNYYCGGGVSYEEMEKIVKYLVILEN